MTDDKGRGLYQFLLHDLEKVSMLSGKFNYTEGFRDLWKTWCEEAERKPPFYDPKFDGYVGRRRTHLMKLSMITGASHGQHYLELHKDDLEWAIDTLEEAEIKMDTVFKGVGKSDIAGLINKTVAFFVSSATDEIPYFQFARHFSGEMDKLTMDRVTQTLEASNIIRVISKPGAENVIKVLESKKKIMEEK